MSDRIPMLGEVLDEVGRLADWALTHRTKIAALAASSTITVTGDPDPDAVRDTIGEMLMRRWDILMCHPESRKSPAMAWLRLLVAASTRDALVAVDTIIQSRDPWLTTGPLGPLAYAAGLSLPEAQSQAGGRTGALALDDLRTLAALRGWRLPPGI